jgi:hypothetical protein
MAAASQQARAREEEARAMEVELNILRPRTGEQAEKYPLSLSESSLSVGGF